MILAADSSVQPPWLVIAGIVGTVIVAYVAARGPVWVERHKAKRDINTPAQKITGAEEVLREWLEATIRERDKALKDVERLGKRIERLEKELIRLGWDGRTA